MDEPENKPRRYYLVHKIFTFSINAWITIIIENLVVIPLHSITKIVFGKKQRLCWIPSEQKET